MGKVVKYIAVAYISGMKDKVNKFTRKEVVNHVRDSILSQFEHGRIQCLIAYGSSLVDGAVSPNDFDFLLLLDKYDPTDVAVLKDFSSIFPTELFIDYKDQILRKGLNNYQRGRHGVYFFATLAYAECVVGNNFYQENLFLISPSQIKRDLLFRIEEYFYRIQKHYLNSRSEFDQRYIKKYIARIVFDICLFKEEIPLEDFHKMHYLDILREYVLAEGQAAEPFDFDDVPNIVGELYEQYLQCFDSIKLNKNE